MFIWFLIFVSISMYNVFQLNKKSTFYLKNKSS